MSAALAGEDVLAADETPVSVLDRAVPAVPAAEETADPDEGCPAPTEAPHVMIVRTPDERLTFLQAIASRRACSASDQPVFRSSPDSIPATQARADPHLPPQKPARDQRERIIKPGHQPGPLNIVYPGQHGHPG